MRLQLFAAFAVVVWLASAAYSGITVATLSMFEGLAGQPLAAWLFFLAPVMALAGSAVAFAVRRGSAWAPATLLSSPALQASGLLWAHMEKTL